MDYIYIVGDTNDTKALTLLDNIQKMGYRKILPYATKNLNSNNCKKISSDKFNELLSKNIIIDVEDNGEYLYGTPEPFGSTRYVSLGTKSGIKALKKLYGNQITGVFLNINDGDTDDVVIREETDLYTAIADIIKTINNKHSTN